jgi:hypothetical protein
MKINTNLPIYEQKIENVSNNFKNKPTNEEFKPDEVNKSTESVVQEEAKDKGNNINIIV